MGIRNPVHKEGLYYLTLTVVDWVDVFTRVNHKLSIIESLKHCQQNKDLEIYAWCLMSNHLHMIAATKEGSELNVSDVMRDFKKFTSKKIIKQIQMEPESRRDWMLNRFDYAGRNDPKIKNYKFWQEGNEAKEIITIEFMLQKLEYIHQNPVRQMIVTEPEHYYFSSARNYAGLDSLLDVILV